MTNTRKKWVKCNKREREIDNPGIAEKRQVNYESYNQEQKDKKGERGMDIWREGKRGRANL